MQVIHVCVNHATRVLHAHECQVGCDLYCKLLIALIARKSHKAGFHVDGHILYLSVLYGPTMHVATLALPALQRYILELLGIVACRGGRTELTFAH